jgi:hypothetical protein
MLITDKGVLVRTRVSEIRELGRATQGVTLIALDDGAKLSGLQRIVENDATREAMAPSGAAKETDVQGSRTLIAAALAATTLAHRRRRALEPPHPRPPERGQEGTGGQVMQLQQAGLEIGTATWPAARSCRCASRPARCSSSACPPRSASAGTRHRSRHAQVLRGGESDHVRERALALAPGTIGVLLTERFSEDELKQIVASLESPASSHDGRATCSRSREAGCREPPAIEPKAASA